MESVSCDVLVIGSGAAGLRAAISAAVTGREVIVVSKGRPGKGTCTWFSAGVMAGSHDAESSEMHFEGTLTAGRGLNERKLVETLVSEAPHRLEELVQWGIRARFLHGYLFAGGRPPVLGEEIVRCLLGRNKDLGTRFLEGRLVTDILIDDGVIGVNVFRQSSGEWLAIRAKAVVLASGGAGALYSRHDNPKRMLGDGYRLALDAGAVLQDMEFVQFYPVCLAEPGLFPMVIPPRLADSGRLINSRGEEILEKYGISERPAGEKARDRLSRALFQEMHGEGNEVYLDLRSPHDIWSKDPFSAAVRPILGERYGALHRPLRVAPAAHHTMGGVVIDRSGQTSVPGLFAAGEVTGGLHGANRMGGNALSETLVFGARAGSSAAEWAAGKNTRDTDDRLLVDRLRESRFKWERIAGSPSSRPSHQGRGGALGTDQGGRSSSSPGRISGGSPVTDHGAGRGALPAWTPEGALDKLRRVMWDQGGILRDRQGLLLAGGMVGGILEELSAPGSGPRNAATGSGEPGECSKAQNSHLAAVIELFSAARVAGLIIEAALKREESRGAHFREDFPDQNDKRWRGHLQVHTSPRGEDDWNFMPVC